MQRDEESGGSLESESMMDFSRREFYVQGATCPGYVRNLSSIVDENTLQFEVVPFSLKSNTKDSYILFRVKSWSRIGQCFLGVVDGVASISKNVRRWEI